MDELLQHACRLADQSTTPLFVPVQGRVAYMVSHAPCCLSNDDTVRSHGIACALKEHGFETLCFVRPGYPWDIEDVPDSIPAEETIQGVRYVHSRWRENVPRDEKVHLEASLERFLELFRVYRPQWVLAASDWIVSLPAWIAARRLDLPFYTETSEFPELSRDAREPSYRETTKYKEQRARDSFVAQQAKQVFTLNDPMKRELMRRGVKKDRIGIVPNGVGNLRPLNSATAQLKAQLGIGEGDKVIGHVGRFSACEGLDVLLDACSDLVQKGEKLKLLLVGDDQPFAVASTAGITKTGILDKAPWLIQAGRVPDEQVADYYALIDAIVIPRKKLPVCELVPPMKLAEALAYGKRLVVSDVAPLAEYARKHDGVVTVEAGGAGSLRKALQKSLKMPAPEASTDMLFSAQTERMAKVLRAENERYQWKETQKQVLTNVTAYSDNKKTNLFKEEIEYLPVSQKSKTRVDNDRTFSSVSYQKQTSRALIFTNLGLSTIDGSSVFIANIVNIYSHVFSEVYLLSVQEIGENFSQRISNLPNVSVVRCGSDNTKETIVELDTRLDFNVIFVRGWGDTNLWFDTRYAEKVSYYWPLAENPTADDLRIFGSVGEVAFQTKALRDKTIGLMGDKRNVLIPPLINLSNEKIVSSPEKGKVVVSYIGTLRKECYSYSLLTAMIGLLEEFEGVVELKLAIGKILYEDKQERSEVVRLLDRLRVANGATVEEKVSESRCDEILQSSHLSFSLWEPNAQNSVQVSTKMLDCLSSGCNVICFRTKLHEEILGKEYEFYIDSIDEIYPKLRHSISKLQKERKKFSNNYSLSKFSLEWHVLNAARHYGIELEDKSEWERSLFSKQYDEIYGLYINQAEKRKLDLVSAEYGIPIKFFKGVNGQAELKDRYNAYLNQPLSTSWEKRAGKKRLTIGAMGHLESFINIADDALKKGFKKILILEADVLFHRNCFSLNFKTRPDDFKVHYLGAGKWNHNVEYVGNGEHYRPNETTGTFAVAMDAVALRMLREEWSRYVNPSDVAMWPVTNKLYSECYVSVPNLAICDVASSLTGSGRSQERIAKKFDWSLESYNLSSVESVNRYFDKVLIEFDCVLRDASIVVVCQNRVLEISPEGPSVCLCIEDVLVEIVHDGVLLKKIEDSS